MHHTHHFTRTLLTINSLTTFARSTMSHICIVHAHFSSIMLYLTIPYILHAHRVFADPHLATSPTPCMHSYTSNPSLHTHQTRAACIHGLPSMFMHPSSSRGLAHSVLPCGSCVRCIVFPRAPHELMVFSDQSVDYFLQLQGSYRKLGQPTVAGQSVVSEFEEPSAWEGLFLSCV